MPLSVKLSIEWCILKYWPNRYSLPEKSENVGVQFIIVGQMNEKG